MWKILKSALNSHKTEETGSTTVEFMIAMPLVVFWFAGTYTFFDAYSEWTRSVKATYTVADILSRQTEIDDDYIDDMNALFASIMGESSNKTYLVISSIEKANDTLSIHWTDASGLHTGLASDTEIPTSLIPNILNGEYVILVESHMPFVPFQTNVGLTSQTLSKQVVVSPRFASKLANSDRS